MSDKDLRNQLEGLFSDIIPEMETEKKDESLLEEAVAAPAEIEPVKTELMVPETHVEAGVEPEHITKEIPLSPAEERGAPPMPATPAKPTLHLTVGRSIRTQWLVLLLALTTISVLTVSYLGVDSVQSVGASAQQISAEALRAQAEEYLRQVTVGDAQRNDLALKKVQQDAKTVAQYAAGIFEKPDAFTGEAYWRAQEHMFTGPGGQYMNGETDVCSVFVPNFANINDELLTALELSAYLDLIFVPTYESNPNTAAIYLATEQEITRYYPNIKLGTVVPPDFQVTQRPWYLSAAPEKNPERAVVWSPTYVDATGKGLMVTAAAPIYTSPDKFVGVIGIDITLKDISANVKAARLLGTGYSFLIDDTGHAIALPEQGYQDILGRVPEPGEFGTDLSGATTEFAPVLIKMIAGSAGFDTLEVGGKELFIAYAPLESTGWSLANVVEAERVLQAVGSLQKELETSTRSLMLARVLPVAGGILVVMAGIGLLLTHRLLDPIRKMATVAQRIGAGQWDAPLPRAGNDEIGVLSQAFTTMTVQLRELLEGLERQVAERTADLARRSTQLEAAAQVARGAAAIRDVERLLEETAHLISDRFGFYHTGIFLLDESGEYAVLRASSSEGGQRMLTQGHRLKVGEVGIVGYAAGSGQPRIALDVGADAVFFDNPDLPQTRSEMALPLKVQDRVIGVLDVQSTEAAAFSDEDMGVLQTLADQVALAIDDARLLAEAQASLKEMEKLQRLYLREQWAALVPALVAPSYERTRPGVTPLGDAVLSEGLTSSSSDFALSRAVEQAMARQEVVVQSGGGGEAGQAPSTGGSTGSPRSSGQAVLVAPISLRGTVIGALGLHETENERWWTDEEIALIEAVADQMALAIENTRLLEQTQRHAAREKLLADITTRVRSSMDPQTILQTAVRELGAALGTDRAFIRLGPGTQPSEE